MNSFEWFYQVGNTVQENGKNILKDSMYVDSPERAENLVNNGKYNCARRFRCDKIKGMVDEEWYRSETHAWI